MSISTAEPRCTSAISVKLTYQDNVYNCTSSLQNYLNACYDTRTFHNTGTFNMRNPWEVNPLLSQDHLVELAKFITDIRGDVVDLYDPNGLGDTKRGLGLRVYECSRSRLIREASSNRKPWLQIVTPEGRFTFSINGVPVRFYRGFPETPEERRFIPSPAALQQQSLLPLSESDAAILWFFVVEADSEHYADKVTFCGFDAETHEQVSSWEVPLIGAVASKPAPVGEKVEPVAKPEVKVKLKAKSADQRKNA